MSEVKYVEFLNFLNFGGDEEDEKQLVGLRQASGRRQKYTSPAKLIEMMVVFPLNSSSIASLWEALFVSQSVTQPLERRTDERQEDE